MKEKIKKTALFLVQVIVILLVMLYVIPWSLKLPDIYEKIVLTTSLVLLILIILFILAIKRSRKGGSKGLIKKFLDWDRKLEKKSTSFKNPFSLFSE